MFLKVKAYYSKSKRKKAAFGIITWFRILLWWGVEVARNIIPIKKPVPHIERISRSNQMFSDCCWVWSNEGIYCLSARKDRLEIVIREIPMMGRN